MAMNFSIPQAQKEQLFKKLNLTDLSADKQKEMIKSLSTLLDTELSLVFWDNLPTDKKAEYARLLAGEESGNITEFLQNNLPNFSGLLAATAGKVMKDILAK